MEEKDRYGSHEAGPSKGLKLKHTLDPSSPRVGRLERKYSVEKLDTDKVRSQSDDELWKKRRTGSDTKDARKLSPGEHVHMVRSPEAGAVRGVVTPAEIDRRINEAAKLERQRQLEQDPVLPYWEVEILKGPRHLRKHEADFKESKQRERKIFDSLRRKKSIYVTSGGDDMSLTTLATIHKGPVPPDVGDGLILLNEIDKILFQPKEIHYDGMCFCKTKVSRFFTLLNIHGHRMYKIEEKKHGCRNLQLAILDFNTGQKIGRIKRMKRSLQCRDKMYVYSPPENFLGSVEQAWKKHPTFRIKDSYGRMIFNLEMEDHRCFATFAKADKIKFLIKSPDGTVQGIISADWDDLTYLLYLNHHLYGISFPLDLNVIMKLLLMTASIMVYYAHYDGKVVRQVVHLPDQEVRDLIEYQYLSAKEPAYAEDETTVSSSFTDTNHSIRPLISLD